MIAISLVLNSQALYALPVNFDDINDACTKSMPCYRQNGQSFQYESLPESADYWGPVGFAIGIAGIGIAIITPVIQKCVKKIWHKYWPSEEMNQLKAIHEKVRMNKSSLDRLEAELIPSLETVEISGMSTPNRSSFGDGDDYSQ